MSHSPTENSALDSHSTYLQNWDELGTRISRSQSFSGRERNCCFLNTGRWQNPQVARFADVSGAVNLDLIDDCRGVVSTDWDHDGDLDFWVSTRTAPGIRFLRNDLNSVNGFLALFLEGRNCNRDAIGARVKVHLDGETYNPLIQTVRAGDAFVSQASKWLHFGIPPGTNIKRVTVRWPGFAGEEEFEGWNVNGNFKLVQGSGVAVRQEVVTSQIAKIKPVPLTLPAATAHARVVLTRRRKLPSGEFVDFSGKKRSFPKTLNGPMLVNLWASWCGPCVSELKDFQAHAAEIRDGNVQIVALSTDGVENAEGQSDLLAAAMLMKQLNLPFSTGICGEKFLRSLRAMHARIFYKDHPLPMPTSFLVDQNGSVAIVYRGPINADLLLKDADLIRSTDANLVSAELYPLGGRSGIGMLPITGLGFAKAYFEGGYYADANLELTRFIAQVVPRDAENPKQLAEAYHLLAKTQERLGNFEAAVDAYRDALRFAPEALGARASLAIVLWRLGKHSAAEAELQTAEREAKDLAKTHGLLGKIRMQWNQPSRAMFHFQEALLEKPDDRPLRLELAMSFRAVGRDAQAVRQYQKLLAIDRRDLSSANNLAWIYATNADPQIRNAMEALRLALAVCSEIGDGSPQFLDTLAAAYAANGQFSEAVDEATKSINLYRKSGDLQMASQVKQRLEIYQRQMPYVEDRDAAIIQDAD